MEIDQPNSRLPLDLTVEILLLLPFQSILKCRLVSKAWKNVIEDSVFFKLYKNESATLFLEKNALCFLFRRDAANSYTVRRLPIRVADLPTKYSRRHLYADKSNKIACVKSHDGRFLLYNLLSGDLHVADDSPEKLDRPLFYGFGYDSYEDDYKILFGSSTTRFAIFVYSYRNRSRGWQSLEGFSNYADYDFTTYQLFMQAYCFNGHLHYFVTKYGKELPEKTPLVAALDVHDYRLVVFSAPPPIFNQGYIFWGFSITGFDGSLCCTKMQWQSKTMDVWVMKEYGVAESWTKLLSLDMSGLDCWMWPNIELYKCANEREMLVFLQHKNELQRFKLCRFNMDNGVVQVFSEQSLQQSEGMIQSTGREDSTQPKPSVEQTQRVMIQGSLARPEQSIKRSKLWKEGR